LFWGKGNNDWVAKGEEGKPLDSRRIAAKGKSPDPRGTT